MTEPTGEVGWVPQPDSRGTWDIIISCLFTIFVCCWTIVHPDIATPRAPAVQRILDKTICLLIAAVAPEVITFIAWAEYINARRMTTRFASASGLGERWTMTHSFFTDMGGFTVVSDDISSRRPKGWLCPSTMLALLEERVVDPKEIPDKAVIEDKGKADALVKTVAILQAVWLLVQCIARAIQRLPIATIEIATVAYIPCALIIAFFWWHKPMDIEEPIAVRVQLELPTDNVIGTRAVPGVTNAVTIYAYPKHPLVDDSKLAILSVLSHINIWGFVTVSFCLLFGGLHCLAWNFHFPTAVERTLWRSSSIIIALSIPCSWLLSTLVSQVLKHIFPQVWYDHMQAETSFHQSGGRARLRNLLAYHRVIHAAGMALYVVARLYLLVEMFSSLRAQPIAVYQNVEWTNFWPHG